MRGIEVLREKGIPLHAIAVLTERSLDYPDELFDFFASTGFRTVGFNLEETEGSHVVSLAGVHPERLSVKYTAFMDRLFDRWVAAGGQPRIREFQVMAGAISGFMKDNEFRRTPDDVVAFRNIIVNKQGDVFTFSPELASGVPGERARFSIGNVHNLPSASALFSSKKFQILDAEVAKGLARCERECEYFRIWLLLE